MGHCMSGSQLQRKREREKNKPHYLHISQRKHACFHSLKAEKHALNIHAIFPSRFDNNQALIDRKPSGANSCSGCEKEAKRQEVVFKYGVCVPVRLSVSLCLCRHVPPFFHGERILLCAPAWGWVCRGRRQEVSPIHCALFG